MNQRGNMLYTQKDYKGAYDLYCKAIELNSSNGFFFYNRAGCSLQLGRYQEALEDCAKAIQIDTNFLRARIRKARVHYELKEFRVCVDVLRDAFSQDKENKHDKEIHDLMKVVNEELEKSKHTGNTPAKPADASLLLSSSLSPSPTASQNPASSSTKNDNNGSSNSINNGATSTPSSIIIIIMMVWGPRQARARPNGQILD